MSAKPDLTLLLLVRGLVARAEFVQGACTALRKALPAGERGLAALAARAAGGEGPLRGPVWILSDEVYTQTLTLPAGAVEGLGEEETGRALALEAQVLSGVPAAESALGWRPLPGGTREREFWVAHVSRRELEEAATAVRRFGGRLAGVVHPAGLPRRLLADSTLNGRWRRLEIWADASAVVEDLGEPGLVARLGRGALPRGRLESAPAECLVAFPGSAAAAPPAARTFRLEDEETLRAWLALWADVLARTPVPVPVVRVPERPLSTARRAGVAVGFALLVAAACASHYAVHASRWEAARAEWEAARGPVERFERTRKGVAALERRIKELREMSSGGSVGIAPQLAVRILEALSRHCPEGIVIESFEIAWDRSVLRGWATDARRIERLAGDLARDLASEGCRTVPAAKKLHVEGPAAGLYDFELQVLSAAGRPAPRVPQGGEP